MKLALVATNYDTCKPSIKEIQSKYACDVEAYGSIAKARELFSKQFDAIILYAANLLPGPNIAELIRDTSSDAGAIVLLEHIIRPTFSANRNTPVGVVIPQLHVERRADYHSFGANTVWTTDNTEIPYKFLELHLKKR